MSNTEDRDPSSAAQRRRGANADGLIRLRFVERLVSMQVGSTEIVSRLKEKFEIGDTTAWADLRETFRVLSAQDAEERPGRRHRMRTSLQGLYQRAIKSKDWKGAGFALDRLCKLDGLYEPDKVAVTHSTADSALELIERLDVTGRAELKAVLGKVARVKDARSNMH